MPASSNVPSILERTGHAKQVVEMLPLKQHAGLRWKELSHQIVTTAGSALIEPKSVEITEGCDGLIESKEPVCREIEIES